MVSHSVAQRIRSGDLWSWTGGTERCGLRRIRGVENRRGGKIGARGANGGQPPKRELSGLFPGDQRGGVCGGRPRSNPSPLGGEFRRARRGARGVSNKGK